MKAFIEFTESDSSTDHTVKISFDNVFGTYRSKLNYNITGNCQVGSISNIDSIFYSVNRHFEFKNQEEIKKNIVYIIFFKVYMMMKPLWVIDINEKEWSYDKVKKLFKTYFPFIEIVFSKKYTSSNQSDMRMYLLKLNRTYFKEKDLKDISKNEHIFTRCFINTQKTEKDLEKLIKQNIFLKHMDKVDYKTKAKRYIRERKIITESITFKQALKFLKVNHKRTFDKLVKQFNRLDNIELTMYDLSNLRIKK